MLAAILHFASARRRLGVSSHWPWVLLFLLALKFLFGELLIPRLASVRGPVAVSIVFNLELALADGGMVCQTCGLEHPRQYSPQLSEWKLLPGRRPFEGAPPWYDLPAFFRTCPHCGARSFEADWPHQLPKYDRPWRRLDGYVSVA